MTSGKEYPNPDKEHPEQPAQEGSESLEQFQKLIRKLEILLEKIRKMKVINSYKATYPEQSQITKYPRSDPIPGSFLNASHTKGMGQRIFMTTNKP